MINPRNILPLCLSIGVSALLILACGESDSSGDGFNREISFGISDAPVEELESVTITIESMTLNREGKDDVVIETFDGDLERITVDLLDYQGSDSMIIIDTMTLEVGTYQNLRLEILDENTDDSYVLEIGDAERKLLKVPSDELKLGGFEVADDGAQTFVIEFNLTRAMTYNPTPVRYILKPRGVRVVDVEAAALVRGAGLADLLADCDSEVSTNLVNRVYLYEGHGLDVAKLGDAFDPEIDGSVPAGTVEPFVLGVLDENDEYELAFVPSGDYTLALSCHAAADNASLLDGIVIPAPENQLVEITLGAGDELVCDFGPGGVVCNLEEVSVDSPGTTIISSLD